MNRKSAVWLRPLAIVISAVLGILLGTVGENWILGGLLILVALVLAFTGNSILGRPTGKPVANAPEVEAVRAYRVEHPEASIEDAIRATSRSA